MKFAAKIKADDGWRGALLKSDGSIGYMNIVEWGFHIIGEADVRLIPLDSITGRSLYERKNFLMVINPNVPEEIIKETLNALADKKAKEILNLGT